MQKSNGPREMGTGPVWVDSTSGAPAYAPPPPSERALCVDEILEAGRVDWEMGDLEFMLNLYEIIVCLILFIEQYWAFEPLDWQVFLNFLDQFVLNFFGAKMSRNLPPKRLGRVKSFQRWMPHWNGRATASDFHVETTLLRFGFASWNGDDPQWLIFVENHQAPNLCGEHFDKRTSHPRH